jgi:hypothetical protein
MILEKESVMTLSDLNTGNETPLTSPKRRWLGIPALLMHEEL